jgi:hypothetical protein
MLTNLDRFKKDLDSLITKGQRLRFAMQSECWPQHFEEWLKKELGYDDKAAKKVIDDLPSFPEAYQSWYSEAKALIRQLLPDRLSDFVRHYEKPKSRKDLTNESYRIEDYLQGLSANRGVDRIVGPDAAISHFRQQLAIVESVKVRLESSLFDIRQLVQADLFDSELDAAKELPSADGILIALLQLDFARERLAFEPFEDLAVRDNGTPKAIRYGIEALSVQRALVLNGQLEVWSSATGELLGRTDPYVGVNIDLGGTVRNLDAEVVKLKEEEQRRLTPSGDA